MPAAPLPTAAREAAVAVLAVVVLGSVGYGFALGFESSNLHNGLLALTFAAVGLYVLRARPRHLIGTLFVAAGLQSAVMFLARQYALHRPELPGADWLGWFSIWQVPLGMALVGVALLTFPTGRLLGPGWRLPAALMVAACVLLAVASALWPIEDDWRGGRLDFPFALGDVDAVRAALTPVQRACYQAFLLLWVVAVVVRVRRARGDEVRQLRWFVYAVTVMAAVLVGGLAVTGSAVPGLIATALVPVAVGVAVVKHRLYDIDPVIDKTIVVGAMLLLVTAGYTVVVVGVGRLLPVADGVLSVAATAAVAVAFEPVRRRVQQLATRLVHGQRATPYEALAALSERIEGSADDLLAGLAATVANAVGAREVVVWTGPAGPWTAAAAWPPGGPPGGLPTAPPAEAVLREARLAGEVRGALSVRKPADAPLSAAESRLLADLAAQAALVIDRQEKDADLRAAARRVVTAQDAARRRIERDLHDGAQQRLLALGAELGSIEQRAAGAGERDTAGRVGAARDRLLEATAQLRELARGLHPQVLTQDGLGAALATLADTAPIPVRVEVALDRTLSPEVEATAYFLASEAIVNAARHSGAAVVVVRARTTPAGVTVEVADDGVGGADAAAGTGLQGLADRLAVLGARLVVTSPAGGGTVVQGVIPCG